MTEAVRGSLLSARSMVAPIREVLWIFPSGVVAPSSSTLCCITLMILIRRNTISPRTLLLRRYRPTPVRPLWPRVRRTCALFREHARTHTRQPLLYVPSLDSRNERFLINIGRRLFSPTASSSLSLSLV